MPVQYGSIVQEHQATRRAAGVFDVSHMARMRFDGQDSAALLDRLLTRRVSDLAPGRIRYSLVTNDRAESWTTCWSTTWRRPAVGGTICWW
jgi:aminomethyltransferase